MAGMVFILDLVMRPPDVPLDSWPRVLVLFELVFRRIASSHRPFPFVLCIIIFPHPVPLVFLMPVMRGSVSNIPDPERVLARGNRPRGPLPVGGLNGQRSLRSRTMRYLTNALVDSIPETLVQMPLCLSKIACHG
jgi:hypothetical protein